MQNARTLLRSTLLLTAASFLMQTVGVSFNVWLTNRIGAAGIGLFQLIMTVYSLAVTLGCGGVRLAATRLAVEGDAKGENTRRTVLRCVGYALAAGALAGALLLIFSDTAAAHWLADLRAAQPLRILALSLPFVAMSSALNGYFTAVGKVGRYSAVRIAEQAVKIAIVALLLGQLQGRGEAWGCIAITLGVLGSEGFSFLCLFVLYNTERKKYREKTQKFQWARLLHIALPDVAGSGARSVLLTIEHLLIPRGFRKAGASADYAMAVYGNVHGMVFPLLLYPSAILSSLSGMLGPEIAGRYAQGKHGQIAYMIRRVMRMTLFFAFGTAGLLFAFADGLSQSVYRTDDCTFFIRILAPLIPVMYCDMTVDGLLKGLDQQSACMRYNIFDSALCVVLVYLLLPRMAIRGYILILFLSEIINFYLSLRRLTRVSQVEIDPVPDLLVPLCCAFCAPSPVLLLLRLSGYPAWNRWLLALCILAGACAYALLLYAFGALTREDVQWLLRTCGVPSAPLSRSEDAKIPRRRFHAASASPDCPSASRRG